MILTEGILEQIDTETVEGGLLDLSENSDTIRKLSSQALKQVIGQNQAKKVLTDILEEVISEVNIKKDGYDKPIASLMFAGPSGVGKTLLAKVTQQILNLHFNNDVEIVKINCADFAGEEPYSLTRLIGASAGFIGSDKKPVFHPDNIEGKGRVILFDEIEKAGTPFWNILLSILDDGTTDVNYTKPTSNSPAIVSGVDTNGTKEESESDSYIKTFFKDSIIIMTSNVGNDRIEKELSGSGRMGFTQSSPNQEEIDTKSIILDEFSKKFKYEMQGRFDNVVPFEHLTKEDASEIMNQIITRLINNTLKNKNGFVIEFSGEAKQKILDDIVDTKEFRRLGGRYIERYFRTNILPYIARAVNSKSLKKTKTNYCLGVILHKGEIRFSKIPIIEMGETKKQVTKALGK